ncbi:hypothetical protein [Rothia nasimurium]|uniref:hypothetical protein n=1 Tax=Rothia nasimurium TaxID=85336 RepID=UPI001F1FDB0B|nr:hypothetical protein [Rothia nasimurium]
MSLEIHFDQLQEAISSFEAGNRAFAESASLPAAQTTHGKDALVEAHSLAMSELDTLLSTGTNNFDQIRSATQAIFDGFKAADQAGA